MIRWIKSLFRRHVDVLPAPAPHCVVRSETDDRAGRCRRMMH